MSPFCRYSLGGRLVLRCAGFLFLVTVSFPTHADASVHKLKVTDSGGRTETLTHPEVIYSDGHENALGWEYDPLFEVVATGSPIRSKWVHNSRIASVTFQVVRGSANISITLDDGTVVAGQFPDGALAIEGEGQLGKMKFPLNKMRSIEFVEFCNYPDSTHAVLARNAARQRWQSARSSPPTWTVVDGASSFSAQGMCLRNSSSTNSAGNITCHCLPRPGVVVGVEQRHAGNPGLSRSA